MGDTSESGDELGLVQVYWGDGKGKTTAALGQGLRACGHGYRVHVLQFMKGGAGSVEDVRGEHLAAEQLEGFTVEATGEYGWHGFHDGSREEDHEARAEAGLRRAREIAVEGRVTIPEEESDDSLDFLVLDEILYAANRGLLEPDEVVELVEAKSADLEVVLTGGHERPDYACDVADLVSRVEKQRHPMDSGVGARRGTEY